MSSGTFSLTEKLAVAGAFLAVVALGVGTEEDPGLVVEQTQEIAAKADAVQQQPPPPPAPTPTATSTSEALPSDQPHAYQSEAAAEATDDDEAMVGPEIDMRQRLLSGG